MPTRVILKNKDLDENIASRTIEKQKPSAPTEGFRILGLLLTALFASRRQSVNESTTRSVIDSD